MQKKQSAPLSPLLGHPSFKPLPPATRAGGQASGSGGRAERAGVQAARRIRATRLQQAWVVGLGRLAVGPRLSYHLPMGLASANFIFMAIFMAIFIIFMAIFMASCIISLGYGFGLVPWKLEIVSSGPCTT